MCSPPRTAPPVTTIPAARPKLAKGKDAYSDITMVASLWDHGPQMLESMTAKKLAWPRFTPQEMSDVIAYLNSL